MIPSSQWRMLWQFWRVMKSWRTKHEGGNGNLDRTVRSYLLTETTILGGNWNFYFRRQRLKGESNTHTWAIDMILLAYSYLDRPATLNFTSHANIVKAFLGKEVAKRALGASHCSATSRHWNWIGVMVAQLRTGSGANSLPLFDRPGRWRSR